MGRDVAVPAAAYSNTGGGGPQRSFGGRQPPPTQVWPGSVETVKDIEENIWSPRLGIKGKVDITVQVKLQNRDNKVNPIIVLRIFKVLDQNPKRIIIFGLQDLRSMDSPSKYSI